MKTTFALIFGIYLLAFSSLSAQTSVKEKARMKGQEAIKLMDDGKYDASIALLEECEQLDPDNLDYPYEKALAYAMKQDYKKSIKILTPLLKKEGVKPTIYQLLGNSYDHNKQSKKAIAIYDEGIERFPDYPNLYFERGVAYTTQKEYNKALNSFEGGIKANPLYPSNYYASASIFATSTEKVWAVMYGEIFMNLERNTARTEAMSKVLYYVYKQSIVREKDNLMIAFTKGSNIMITDSAITGADPKKIKLPYASLVFEPGMGIAAIMENTIDLDALDRIRTRFLDYYYEKEFHKNYPNALFAYQKQIQDAGHMEAYNHWLLMKGDEKAFNSWKNENEAKWDSFVEWFKENPIKLTKKNCLLVGKYMGG